DHQKLLRRCLGHFSQSAETETIEGAREFLVHTFDFSKSAQRFRFNLLELAFADDVELPTSELRSQTDILSLATNRQAELLVRNYELHPVICFVDNDFVHICRLNGVDDVARG